MRWWKRFRILRKQNDTVKIMTLFFCGGIFFLGKALCNGVGLYQATKTPVEYEVFAEAGKGAEPVSAKACGLDGVIFAGPFRESTVSFRKKGEELTFSCMELSEEYLEKVYGISKKGAMKTFYVNQRAFGMLKKAGNITGDVSELRIGYEQQAEVAEKGGQDSSKGTSPERESAFGNAKVLLIPVPVAEEEPFVCCIGTPLRLKSEEAGIRIWGRLDLTGENMAKLTEEGFTLSDARQMQLVWQEQALKQTELKYSAILAMICLSVPFFLHSAWKMKYHGNSLEWYDRKKDGEE